MLKDFAILKRKCIWLISLDQLLWMSRKNSLFRIHLDLGFYSFASTNIFFATVHECCDCRNSKSIKPNVNVLVMSPFPRNLTTKYLNFLTILLLFQSDIIQILHWLKVNFDGSYPITPHSGSCIYIRNSTFLDWSGGFIYKCMHQIMRV